MSDNIIALLVPFFVLGMVVEAIWSYRRRARAYHLGTMVSDLSTGIASQVFEVFLKALAVLAYAWIYDHWRWVTFDEGSPWPWVIAFFGIDLGFYWWHRLSHVVNFMWGVHVVHHHSEDFNLAVALRQPAFELLTAMFFYFPLALLGVPAHVWVTMYALNLFYQFWTHTEAVGRLGRFETVFNSPSHHRVHHGINPEYLDRNYGGIFIVWDKLFGTFTPEREPPVYGVTTPISSYNPLWANFEYYVQVRAGARRFRRAIDRWRVWLKHPGWQPAELGPTPAVKAVSRASFRKYAPPMTPELQGYVLGHFAVAFIASGVYLAVAPVAGWTAAILPGAVVLATLVALTGVIERKPWAWGLDIARQMATVALVGWYGVRVLPAWAGIGLAALVTGVFVGLQLAYRPRIRLGTDG